MYNHNVYHAYLTYTIATYQKKSQQLFLTAKIKRFMLILRIFFCCVRLKNREKEKLKMKMVEYRKCGIRGNGNGKYIFMFLKYTSCTTYAERRRRHGQKYHSHCMVWLK